MPEPFAHCMCIRTLGRQQDCLPSMREKRIILSSPTVILCIDDEPTVLMLRQVLLSIAGYKVLTATNGESAMRLFTLNHVDLVITDQLLPGRSGGQVASEMKRLKPEVPIILYIGLLELPPGAEHADLVMVKGMPPPEFLGAIAALVAKSRPEDAATS
jgi:DNA-binding response OmpR family regulator